MVKIRNGKFRFSSYEMVNLGSAHIEFEFFYVSGTLGLDLMIMPGKAMVLGSKWTGPGLFSNEIFRFKKNVYL